MKTLNFIEKRNILWVYVEDTVEVSKFMGHFRTKFRKFYLMLIGLHFFLVIFSKFYSVGGEGLIMLLFHVKTIPDPLLNINKSPYLPY